MVAGIVINLLAAYLKSRLDKIAERTFSWWGSKSDKNKAEWCIRIESIRQNESVKNSEFFRELRSRLQAIHLLLIAIFVFVVALFAILIGAPIAST